MDVTLGHFTVCKTVWANIIGSIKFCLIISYFCDIFYLILSYIIDKKKKLKLWKLYILNVMWGTFNKILFVCIFFLEYKSLKSCIWVVTKLKKKNL